MACSECAGEAEWNCEGEGEGECEGEGDWVAHNLVSSACERGLARMLSNEQLLIPLLIACCAAL